VELFRETGSVVAGGAEIEQDDGWSKWQLRKDEDVVMRAEDWMLEDVVVRGSTRRFIQVRNGACRKLSGFAILRELLYKDLLWTTLNCWMNS
jgi:hypothetical protein